MARQRRSKGDLSTCCIAHLTQKENVGILAQQMAQSRCKIEADGGLNIHLGDALQPIFDRILDRHDIIFLALQIAKGAVERRRLAAPGRAADEQEPVGCSELLAKGALDL